MNKGKKGRPFRFDFVLWKGLADFGLSSNNKAQASR